MRENENALMNMQFTWAKNPEWSHFYSYGEEIFQYFKDVVERFGLMKYFVLNNEVTGAYWDEEQGVWDVHVRNMITGEQFVDSADIFINNGGLLK